MPLCESVDALGLDFGAEKFKSLQWLLINCTQELTKEIPTGITKRSETSVLRCDIKVLGR